MLGYILSLLERLIFYVSFISDNSSFPDPLNAPEEENTLSFACAGTKMQRTSLLNTIFGWSPIL